MKEKFTAIISCGEDGYLVSQVIGLPGCRTQAKNFEELTGRTRSALSLYLKANKTLALEDKFVGLFQIDYPELK